MRALIAAVGTRGDVQPALALALELNALEHDVRLCISPNFVEAATRLGLDAVPLGVAMRAPARGATPARPTPDELRRLRASLPGLVADQFETIGAAAAGCNVILGANAHQYAAPSIAESRGVPYVTAVYAPIALPAGGLAPAPGPGASWEAAPVDVESLWRGVRASWNERSLARINAGRASLGLGAFGDQFYWAHRVEHLGIGASTHHADMTPQTLQAALERTLDPAVAPRARALAGRIATNGARLAAERLAALA